MCLCVNYIGKFRPNIPHSGPSSKGRGQASRTDHPAVAAEDLVFDVDRHRSGVKNVSGSCQEKLSEKNVSK